MSEFLTPTPGAPIPTPTPPVPPTLSPSTPDKNGLAVAALVLGIVSLPAALVPLFWWVAIPTGLLGFIFGLVARGKAKKGAERAGMAKAGWITGAIGTILGVIGMVIFFVALNDLGTSIESEFEKIEAELDSYGSSYNSGP